MSALYLYDGAYSPDLATCKRHGAIAMSHYMTGTYASTSAQPAAIRAAGMGALLNWERMPGALVGAARATGQAIGREALAAVPAGCPRDGSVAIYFSVDLDVAYNNLGSCDEAFRGINDVLAGQFRAAVYGEGDLIDHLVSAGILHGKHWLSMSTGFGGFNARSPNVCLVQMHDAAGNWIDTDIPNTDRNTITDPHALGAWWPASSPYANGDAPVTPAEIQAIAAAVWNQPITDVSGSKYKAASFLVSANRRAGATLSALGPIAASVSNAAAAAAVDAGAVAVAVRDRLIALIKGSTQ